MRREIPYVADPTTTPGPTPWPGLDKGSPVPLYFQLRTVIE